MNQQEFEQKEFIVIRQALNTKSVEKIINKIMGVEVVPNLVRGNYYIGKDFGSAYHIIFLDSNIINELNTFYSEDVEEKEEWELRGMRENMKKRMYVYGELSTLSDAINYVNELSNKNGSKYTAKGIRTIVKVTNNMQIFKEYLNGWKVEVVSIKINDGGNDLNDGDYIHVYNGKMLIPTNADPDECEQINLIVYQNGVKQPIREMIDAVLS